MSLQKEFAHLQIPLGDIAKATNNFADENLISSRGGFKRVYKGNLLWSGQQINISAQRFDSNNSQGQVMFWTEILMLSSLKHKNIVSIIGFCDEEVEKIIVTKYEAKGSLDKYLSGPTFTWVRRLKICLGVARALSYIHYDEERDYSIIHLDIKSSKVLLDDNWEPKVSGFELSMKNSAARRHSLFLTPHLGTVGCQDPAYKNTRGVTNKSDVFSFGVLLFEILCSRRAYILSEDNCFSAQSNKLYYKNKKLNDLIDSDLRKQMDLQSFNILSETTCCCLKEDRAHRPNMDQIVIKLEKALELQLKHENPEHTTVALTNKSSNHWKGKNLEYLKIGLKDIEFATENFAQKYCIGSGGYGMVYKVELDHFDGRISPTEGKNKNELPKRRSTVAIKRIHAREDGQGEQGFFAELELLTSCKHPNVVSLLGFCDEGPEMILIYEYASNRSLNDYLGSTENMINLTWLQRLNICLDIAHGLKYLHTSMHDKQKIIHRDIKSANILLGEKWEARIADFGLSKIYTTNQQGSTFNTKNIAGTEVYLDPEYMMTGKLKKESDIYSFGVVLFEILCGRMAYDEIFNLDNDKGLPSIARRRFNDGTIKEMVDPRIKEETDEKNFSLNRGPNHDSLEIFINIANRCLAQTQAGRPTMEVIIKELEKALYFQENRKDIFKIPLTDIQSATENFSYDNCISSGRFGSVYKGEVKHVNGHKTIVAKRFDKRSGQGEAQFLKELKVLLEYKHESIISFIGYCKEMDERIIVYEHASQGSLDKYVKDVSLTWMNRLKICIDVANGLDFLHGSVLTHESVIHRDIRSGNILLTGDWKAKISNFGNSLTPTTSFSFVVSSTMGYCDPEYQYAGFITTKSDIFSFGVFLYEILLGSLAVPVRAKEMRRFYEEGSLDKMVFEGIKEQIDPKSFITFAKIAYQCLCNQSEFRPSAGKVVIQLKKALEFQEDIDIWELKLPKDYKKIIEMSNSPEIYSTEKKKDIYNMLSKGILLREGQMWFSLGSYGERNEMISAKKFSLINRCPHKWQSVPESRFQEVAEMFDIMNLGIKIKTRTHLLSRDVVYGVYLVFKFRNSRKFSDKPMYVNLKYKQGSKILHAYFATQRDKEWMMIELCRFLNDKEDVVHQFLLKSFSRYYCRDGAIYVEGIEFRAINKANLVKHEEIEKLKEMSHVLESNSDVGHAQKLPTGRKEFKRSENNDEDGKLSWLTEVNGKKHLMLSAKAALYDISNVKLFTSKPSTESRFQEIIEVLPHQVIRINCKIKSHMLSRDTEYLCYLVFKLSEICCGLHCPVKVRDLLHRNNKEDENIYLRSPSPWNIHDISRVPKQREDGWMEVKVWKLNSNHELKRDCINVNLKFISYEGTMAGLILCGLDFRPM